MCLQRCESTIATIDVLHGSSECRIARWMEHGLLKCFKFRRIAIEDMMEEILSMVTKSTIQTECSRSSVGSMSRRMSRIDYICGRMTWVDSTRMSIRIDYSCCCCAMTIS